MATFGQIITKLREDSLQKRQETADALGISRASLEYYEKDKRKPDIEVLTKIADYYHVSADYLLGRTNAKTTDKDAQFVCEYTGLSDESVAALHEQTFMAYSGDYRVSDAVDFLLQGDALVDFSSICEQFHDYQFFWQKRNLLLRKMGDYLNGSIEKTEETYKNLCELYFEFHEMGDKRDVQKLRMQETLYYCLLEEYCKEEKFQSEEFEEIAPLYEGLMMELDNYLFSSQQKDGEPHGNDQ